MDDQGGANPEVKLTYPVDIFGQRTGTWAEYTNWTGWNVYWSQVAGQRLNMGGSSAFIDHSDAVGSTTMETDPSGAVVWDVTHYPSGKVFQEQGTRQSEVAMGLDWQVNDPAIPSATREYNFRVYRWMSPDPMGGDVTNPQSLNRYAYVLNNPTTLTDPLGLEGSNPADPCSDPSYSNARCPGPPGCSWLGNPNCCPGPSIGGFNEEFCYPLSGDFPPPNPWNPLPAITQPTAAGQFGALGFSPESASQGVIDLRRFGPLWKVISTLCRGNVRCIEAMKHAMEFGLLGVVNPWSPQAQALKASVKNPKGTPNEPQTPRQPVEDTRGPGTLEDYFDKELQNILGGLAGVARGNLIPDVVGPIVSPRVIVPQSPQVPQGGVY